MPIYEYRCGDCGHELETLQKLSEAPLTHCPACEGEGLTKKVSAAAFRLKGGGWYETDFKSKDRKNLAGDAAKSDSGDKKADSGKAAESGSQSADTSAKSNTDKPASKPPATKGSDKP